MDVRFKDILKLFGFLVLLEVVVILLYPRSLPENNELRSSQLRVSCFYGRIAVMGSGQAFQTLGLPRKSSYGA